MENINSGVHQTAIRKSTREQIVPTIPEAGDIPIGLRIQARRYSQAITIGELAREVNRDYSYLSHIEHGRVPIAKNISRIASALQTTPEELENAEREQLLEWVEIGRERWSQRNADILEARRKQHEQTRPQKPELLIDLEAKKVSGIVRIKIPKGSGLKGDLLIRIADAEIISGNIKI